MMIKGCPEHPRYVPNSLPRTNCRICWSGYWTFQKGHRMALNSAIKQMGRDKVITIVGEKLIKHLERFEQQ